MNSEAKRKLNYEQVWRRVRRRVWTLTLIGVVIPSAIFIVLFHDVKTVAGALLGSAVGITVVFSALKWMGRFMPHSPADHFKDDQG
ncbi:MAG: hypothetical protein ABR507_02480 [Actinomycetota bacterium]